MYPAHAIGRRDPTPGERGFTLVEVMVAIFVLLVGVLGTVTLINGSNRTTSTTRARESATNVARAVIEGARAISYTDLNQTDAAGAIQTQPGMADASGAAGWQIVRRNITYTAAISVCTVDDPADGIGTNGSAYCQARTTTNPPDAHPADYKRVKVTLSWTDPSGAHQTTQAGVVTASYHGPSVTALDPPASMTFPVTGGTNAINFAVTTTAGAESVKWSVDGNVQGPAIGGGTAWAFSWTLGTAKGSAPCSPTATGAADGTYVIRADAYDATGLSDLPRAVTVQLNRCPPSAPTGLEGGETILWPGIELVWDRSDEEDVVGYYVYKKTSATGAWSRAPASATSDPCNGLLKKPSCIAPDSTSNVYYGVSAVDRDPAGNLREGAISTALLVDPRNRAPDAPSRGGLGSTPYTAYWDEPRERDRDQIIYYWIYRDSTSGGRASRYDSVANDPSGTTTWTDPDPGTGSHTYWVTAVDEYYGESNLSQGVTLP